MDLLHLHEHFENVQEKSNKFPTEFMQELEMMSITFTRSYVHMKQIKYDRNHTAWYELDIESLNNSHIQLVTLNHEDKKALGLISFGLLTFLVDIGVQSKTLKDYFRKERAKKTLLPEVKNLKTTLGDLRHLKHVSKEIAQHEDTLNLYNKEKLTLEVEQKLDSLEKGYKVRKTEYARKILKSVKQGGTKSVVKILEKHYSAIRVPDDKSPPMTLGDILDLIFDNEVKKSVIISSDQNAAFEKLKKYSQKQIYKIPEDLKKTLQDVRHSRQLLKTIGNRDDTQHLYSKDSYTQTLKKNYQLAKTGLAKTILSAIERGNTKSILNILMTHYKTIIDTNVDSPPKKFGALFDTIFDDDVRNSLSTLEKDLLTNLHNKYDAKPIEYIETKHNKVHKFFRKKSIAVSKFIRQNFMYGLSVFSILSNVGFLGYSIKKQLQHEEVLRKELEVTKIKFQNAINYLEEEIPVLQKGISELKQDIEVSQQNEFRRLVEILKNATELGKAMFPRMRFEDNIIRSVSSQTCQGLSTKLCDMHFLDGLMCILNSSFSADELLDMQLLIKEVTEHFNEELKASAGTLQLLVDVKIRMKTGNDTPADIKNHINKNCEANRYLLWDENAHNATHRCPEYQYKDAACMMAYVLAQQNTSMRYNCMNLKKYNVLELPETTCPDTPELTLTQLLSAEIKGIIKGLLIGNPKITRKKLNKKMRISGHKVNGSVLKCALKNIKRELGKQSLTV